MMHIEQSLSLRKPARSCEEVEFLLRGVSVAEYLEVGTLTTVSPWVQNIADEPLEQGYATGRIDSSYTGQRISDVLDAWDESGAWRMPTLTELAAFSSEKQLIGGVLVSLMRYETKKKQSMAWVPYARGNFLGMWPTGHILPVGSSILLVKG